VQTSQLPLPVLADKYQCDMHLHIYRIAPIGRFLSETTNQDSGLIVPAHPDLIQGVSGVLHISHEVRNEVMEEIIQFR
jgi:hypothetical protein